MAENKYYGVYKTTWDSSRHTYAEEHAHDIYAIMENGIGSGCLFKSQAFSNKDDAQAECYQQREWARYDRSRARYGYCSYKDKVFVHESDWKGNYLPTVKDIKDAIDLMKSYVMDNPKAAYGDLNFVDFLYKNRDIKPAVIHKFILNGGKCVDENGEVVRVSN